MKTTYPKDIPGQLKYWAAFAEREGLDAFESSMFAHRRVFSDSETWIAALSLCEQQED